MEGMKEILRENYPGKSLIDMKVLPNADFTDSETIPRGIITIHPIDATVHQDSIPNDMFDYLIVCEIHDPEKKLVDSDFLSKSEKLCAQIPQFSHAPPRMIGLENKVWAAELGNDGYAGIYKEISRDPKYFVVVKAGAELACKDFKRKIINEEKRQFKDMYYDSCFNFTKSIAKRNAERIAYCVSRVMGVNIDQIEDVSAKSTDIHIARPYKAATKSGYTQEVSTMDELSYAGQLCMGVYHNVRPQKLASKMAIINAGPYEGLAILHISRSISALGVPVDTGVGVAESDVTEKTMKERASPFVWEKKTSNFHPELVPGKHNPFNQNFLEQMIKLGWKNEVLNSKRILMPVMVKIGNPELDR
jgi:hypothetical protein